MHRRGWSRVGATLAKTFIERKSFFYALLLLASHNSKAAKFGKAFLDLYDPTDYINMGQALKVLNAVRYFEIGIPITYIQYA